MFAKPVDNPAAMGFWKNRTPVNIYKSVISSDLEAEQFYKMGYTEDDLIKCGLPKFDISRMSKSADKILFMPTYRYWEEASVVDPKRLPETSYYKLFVGILKTFKDAELLDRLIVTAHPKFVEYLNSSLPEYNDNFTDNIGKALENSKIFITDYSSASYDAHYRGANVIYYWKEKDYLISNYKAIPPVNESNCDGKPVYSENELIKEVKRLIKNGFKQDKKYENRYKKINEFSDNKNWLRLTKELVKLDII